MQQNVAKIDEEACQHMIRSESGGRLAQQLLSNYSINGPNIPVIIGRGKRKTKACISAGLPQGRCEDVSYHRS